MTVYEDGTRDCPRCLYELEKPTPNRVRGTQRLCSTCENAAHNEAMAGLAQMEPFMRRHLAMTDWLIEHGLNPLGAE